MADLIPYDIPIRPDVRGRLILPADLTDQEAERLCAIIRAIAMPEGALMAEAAEEAFCDACVAGVCTQPHPMPGQA